MAVVLPAGGDHTPETISRRPECAPVKRLLSNYRPLAEITAPGTLDGGDVLCVGRTLYAGLSSRSSQEGLSQMAGYIEPYGFRLVPVEVSGCLHLKSAVTQVADDLLLVNPDWVDVRLFGDHDCIEIDPAEPLAANALQIGEALIYRHHSRARSGGLSAAASGFMSWMFRSCRKRKEPSPAAVWSSISSRLPGWSA
jgi:N-dimethylarginine dimethylaminohydrolase